MREELLRNIETILINSGIKAELVRSKLVILLDNYEITERCTDVAVVTDESEIAKYMRMFLISKRVAGRTERTLKYYEDELNRFFREVQKSPLDVTASDINMYLAIKEVRDGVSKVTQKNAGRVISAFYTWMFKEEYILRNPMNKVEDIKLPKIKKHAFDPTDIERLRNNVKGLRDKAIFEVLLSTWCRVSEVAGMNRTDIKGNTIEVLGKGQKTRRVYLNPSAIIALEAYLNTRTDDNEALFVSNDKPHDRLKMSRIEVLIRDLGRASNVDKCHPHRFRRTGATYALRRGMPIEQVSKLLGHESIETTQIYLDISEQELEASHRKYV